jgi:hypothetical protein
MLNIRLEQFQALTTAVGDRANRELAHYARSRFPAKLAEIVDSELLAIVVRVRQVAQSYAIDREDNIATFLDLTMMYGEDFHKDRWAAEVLTSDALHGPDKMVLLRHKVRLTNVLL